MVSGNWSESKPFEVGIYLTAKGRSIGIFHLVCVSACECAHTLNRAEAPLGNPWMTNPWMIPWAFSGRQTGNRKVNEGKWLVI